MILFRRCFNKIQNKASIIAQLHLNAKAAILNESIQRLNGFYSMMQVQLPSSPFYFQQNQQSKLNGLAHYSSLEKGIYILLNNLFEKYNFRNKYIVKEILFKLSLAFVISKDPQFYQLLDKDMGTVSPSPEVQMPFSLPRYVETQFKYFDEARPTSQEKRMSTNAYPNGFASGFPKISQGSHKLQLQIQDPIWTTTSWAGSNDDLVIKSGGSYLSKQSNSIRIDKTYNVNPIEEFEQDPSSMDLVKLQAFPSLLENTYIKPKQFSPEQCSGLLKRRNTNFYEHLGVNAFLISSSLVIASSQEINKYQRHQLIFFSYFKQEQFEIQEIVQNDKIREDGKTPLNICLIRLKKEIVLKQYNKLAINFQRNFELTEILSLQFINRNNFKASIAKVGEYSFDENQNVMLYSTNLSPTLDGSPIVLRKDGESFVVGIHFKNESQNAKYNSSGTIIQESLLLNLCKWLSQIEREFIEIYLLNENKSITLANFVSFLNIQSSLYPSWLKFDKSKFIKKSQQMYAQRLGGYIDFSMNGRFIEYITVNGTRLYFDLYHPQKVFTILDLKLQYAEITKSNLLLSTKDLILSVNIALKSIIHDKKNREMFQRLLNEMQKGKFKISTLPKWFLEGLQKLKKTQVYINLPKKSQMICIIVKKQAKLIECFNYQYQQNSNIQQILAYLSTKQYDVGNVEVYYSLGLINEKDYTLPIKSKQLTFHLIGNQSFISKNSKIWLSGINKELSLEQFERGYQHNAILTFQQASSQLKYQKITSSFITHKINTLYTLIYKSKQTNIEIECSSNTLFRLVNQTWIMAKNLQLGDIILGTNLQNQGLIEYQLIQRKIRYEQNPMNFVCFQVANTHTLVANRLIIHNSNKFSIKVVEQLGIERRESMKTFYRNQIIGQVFEGYDVWMGGKKLNKDLTFGDYQIESSKCLLVSSQQVGFQSKYLKVDLLVTKWNESCKPYQKYTLEERNNIKEHYIGILNGRLQVLDDQLFESLQQRNSPHLIIEQKKKIMRTHYYETQEYFLQSGLQTLQKFSSLRQYDRFRQICEQISKEIKQDRSVPAEEVEQAVRRKIEEIFPIFVYTTSVYKQLNNTLREMDIAPKKQSKSEHFLSLSSTITRILRKRPSLKEQILVYRGISNCNINFQGATDNMILFEGFTSTTKNKQTAIDFAAQNGIVIQIRTLTGRQISRYSLFKKQDEILLFPFTYFFYEGYYIDDETGRKIYKLRQICLPSRNKESITFWIDDRPFNNSKIILDIWDETEVVEVSSTQIMKIILKDFFWIYTFVGKRIIIVSDMVRKEGNKQNKEAGADLLKLIYNQLGLSNAAYIFTSRLARTERTIRSREITRNRWRIFTIESKFVEQIKQISNSQRLVC